MSEQQSGTVSGPVYRLAVGPLRDDTPDNEVQAMREDRETVRVLDEAVAAFKAALGSDNGDDVWRTRAKVYEALLVCSERAAVVRGQRQRGEL